MALVVDILGYDVCVVDATFGVHGYIRPLADEDEGVAIVDVAPDTAYGDDEADRLMEIARGLGLRVEKMSRRIVHERVA